MLFGDAQLLNGERNNGFHPGVLGNLDVAERGA